MKESDREAKSNMAETANSKHSKPTTKDMSDIYEEYSSLNEDVNKIFQSLNTNISGLADSRKNKREAKLIKLKDIDCLISLYYDEDFLYLNNYLLEISVMDECFSKLNSLLSRDLVHLLKTNKNYEGTEKFVSYEWRDLIDNNQLILFLTIFNFYIDNPLTFIIDKLFKDFVFSVNSVFTIKNYDICNVMQYVLPSDIYDISKKPEIITNSENFMDKVSEILIINHLLSGCIYLFNDSINILELLDLFFYNNKKMDYTRHGNMKVFKKVLEKIYLHFDMRSHSTSSLSLVLDSKPSDSVALQRKFKNFPLSNLLCTLKQSKMQIDDECKNLFLTWFSKFSIKWENKGSEGRVPYCQAVIQQLISLFQLNNIGSYTSSASNNSLLKENFLGFNFDFSRNKKYETFYKIMKCPPSNETASINLNILTKNLSNIISFENLEKQLVWTIDQEITSPLSVLKQSANKFIFKAAYYTIHQSYLKYIAGKCLRSEKFKEIYEFIDLHRFNDFNTIFYKEVDLLTFFNINTNDFIRNPMSVRNKQLIKPVTTKISKSFYSNVIENSREIENNLNSKSASTKKPETKNLRPQQHRAVQQKPVSTISMSPHAMDLPINPLISTQHFTNRVTKPRYYENSSANIFNLQLANSFDIDASSITIKKESFENDLTQYLQTMGLELA